MSARRIPRAPLHSVWLSPARSRALMFAEIRDHADRGSVVQIIRAGGGAFQVIRNGERFFVRSSAGHPVATVDTVLEAVTAGDAHLDFRPDDDPEEFGGAA